MHKNIFFVCVTHSEAPLNALDDSLGPTVTFIKDRLEQRTTLSLVRFSIMGGVGDSPVACAQRLGKKLATLVPNIDLEGLIKCPLFDGCYGVGLSPEKSNLLLLLDRLLRFLFPLMFCVQAGAEKDKQRSQDVLCCVVNRDIMSLLQVICGIPDGPKEGDAIQLSITESGSDPVVSWKFFGIGQPQVLLSLKVDSPATMLMSLMRINPGLIAGDVAHLLMSH